MEAPVPPHGSYPNDLRAIHLIRNYTKKRGGSNWDKHMIFVTGIILWTVYMDLFGLF